MFSAYIIKNVLEHLRGIDVTIEPNTTLNEKYGILTNMNVPSGILPKLQYLGIGRGGIGDTLKVGHHRFITTGLYDALPFVCRTINTDLTQSEANKYRFRVVKNINGIDYVFYYLKHIETLADSINIKTITKSNNDTEGGSVDRFDFNNPEILNPTPDLSIGTIDPNKSLFHIVECKIAISLNQEEKEEIKNAYSILTGSGNVPNISEMCLYTGLDTTLPNGTIEAHNVRSGVFYAVPYEVQPLLNVPGVTQRYIDIGGMRLN